MWDKILLSTCLLLEIKRDIDEKRLFEIEVGSFKVYSFLERILMAGL